MPTWTEFPQAKLRQANGNAVDFDGDDIRLILLTSGYVQSDSHDFADDLNLAANEVSGTGYTANGIPLLTETVTQSGTTTTFDAGDVTIGQNAAGFSNARHAVLVKWVTSAADSPLIAYSDMGADQGNVAGDLVFEWSANGIIQWV